MNPVEFNQSPSKVLSQEQVDIHSFSTEFDNIDKSVVESFGEEWSKFNSFTQEEIDKIGDMYFDIVDETVLHKGAYGIDIGCGTGRWSKYLVDKIGFIEAVDPSKAIFSAAKLLADHSNVRFSIASTDNLPFADETFDFGMSIGVLHHIPDTQKAMSDCVKKIKRGGHFYVYTYYDLDNRGVAFRTLFRIVNSLRKIISSLPATPKKWVCDLIAVFVYGPLILLGKGLKGIGLRSLAEKVPLNMYQQTSFYVVRNDSLDRFGTSLEQRFSKEELKQMMQHAGLSKIKISDGLPYWHAIGERT